MAIEGDVRSDDLVNLLQVLTLQRRTGILRLRSLSGCAPTAVVVSENGVGIDGAFVEGYPGLLVTEGLATPDTVQPVLDAVASGADPLAAVRAAPTLAAHVDAWRAATRRERLLGVFETGPWRFVFDEKSVPNGREHIPVDFIVLEAARREDESRSGRRLGMRAVVLVEGRIDDPLESWIASRFDGVTTIAAVATSLGLPTSVVLEVATRLVACEAARRLVGPEIVARLRTLGGSDDPAITADLLVEASRAPHADADTAAEAARACRIVHRLRDAVVSARLAAQRMRMEGRFRESATLLLEAHGWVGAMPRLLALGLRRAAEADIESAVVAPHVETAQRLAVVLASAGGGREAMSLLEAACAAMPNDLGLHRETSRLGVRHQLGGRAASALVRQMALEERLGDFDAAVATGEILADFDVSNRRDHLVHVNVLKVRAAFRRKLAEGRRVLKRGLAVGAVLASVWVGWAALGERRLSALGGGDADAADYAAAASPYALVPAGFEMRAQAAFLRNVERTAREIGVERSRLSEERASAREKKAKDAVERARHALAEDDFETAIVEYRAAAALESPVRKTALSELADVEREVRDASALLRAALACEASGDDAGAHALRSRALSKHGRVPAVRAMPFRVRLITTSDDLIEGGGTKGVGTLDVVWSEHRPLEVVVTGPGATSRAVTLPFPPSSHEIAVVREKASVASIDLRGGIAHLGSAGDGRIFATLRSGVVVLVDSGGEEVARHVPTSFETPKYGPVRSADRVIVSLGSGRARILDYPKLDTVRTATLPGEVRGVAAASDGWRVIVGNDVHRVGFDGTTSPVGDAPRGLRDLAFDGDTAWGIDASGALARVDLDRGTTEVVDPSGTEVRPLGGGWTARRGPDGWWTIRGRDARVQGGLSPSRSVFVRAGNRIAAARQDGRIDFLPTPID